MSGNNRRAGDVDHRMRVEIWSDIVCPWCYIGKRRFERAVAEFEGRDEVEVVWRSFELQPDAPALQTGSAVEALAEKYGVSVEQIVSSQARTTAVAAAEGIEYHLDTVRRGNTFDAHRLLHLAAEHGKQDELKERLFRAYFTESLPVGDRDVLRRAAADVGIPADEVDAVLTSDRYADAVRHDEATAARLGCTGVPFFVVDRSVAVAGAQDPTVLLELLRSAGDAATRPASPAR